jgi:hypothetical protein
LTDATHSYSTLETDVTSFTPVGSPAVLDEPIVNATRVAISNNSDGMVNSCARGTASKNTSLIELKRPSCLYSGDNSPIGVDKLLKQSFVC